MKKILALLLAVLMTVSLLTACGAKTETASSEAASSEAASSEPAANASSDETASSEETDAASYTIGICNYVDDASLNQIVENIQTRLAEISEETGMPMVRSSR